MNIEYISQNVSEVSFNVLMDYPTLPNSLSVKRVRILYSGGKPIAAYVPFRGYIGTNRWTLADLHCIRKWVNGAYVESVNQESVEYWVRILHKPFSVDLPMPLIEYEEAHLSA